MCLVLAFKVVLCLAGAWVQLQERFSALLGCWRFWTEHQVLRPSKGPIKAITSSHIALIHQFGASMRTIWHLSSTKEPRWWAWAASAVYSIR
mgnify:CR=1 FL=1